MQQISMTPRLQLFILCALSVLCGFTHAAETAQKPNIFYLVIDNVTFVHLGKAFGGNNVTPAMDSIAQRGVRFERMYVTAPLCVPSRYSILTGRYPERCTSPAFLEANPAHESWYEVGQVELEPDRPNLPPHPALHHRHRSAENPFAKCRNESEPMKSNLYLHRSS